MSTLATSRFALIDDSIMQLHAEIAEKERLEAEEKSRLAPHAEKTGQVEIAVNQKEEFTFESAESQTQDFFATYCPLWQEDQILRPNLDNIGEDIFLHLPKEIRNIVYSVSENLLVDQNMVLSLTLWSLSAVTAHKYKVRYPQSKDGETLCLWLQILAESGTGKSPTANFFRRILEELFFDDQKDWKLQFQTMENTRYFAQKDFENGKFFTKDSSPEEKAEIKEEFNRKYPEPPLPYPQVFLNTGDMTQEFFTYHVNTQGHLVVLTTEGEESYNILNGM